MADDAGPPLLDDPVWYAALLYPSWLLPRLRDGAPSVLVVPSPAPAGEAPLLASLRAGLPLALAEAVRFSTDARTSAATGPWAVRAGADAVVEVGVEGDGDVRTLRLRITGSDRVLLDDVAPAATDAALGEAVARAPMQTVHGLRDANVRSVWSTVYVPPAPARAVEQIRAYRACAYLQDRAVYAEPTDDADAISASRARVHAALRLLGDQATRGASALDVARFLAGLAAVKAMGSNLYQEFRLPANSIAMSASDPRDPLFALSVVALALYGDTNTAGRRAAAAATAGADDDLRTWLARARSMG
jgi:hypothetical protein